MFTYECLHVYTKLHTYEVKDSKQEHFEGKSKNKDNFNLRKKL